MNRAELEALPAVVDVATAARVMGLSRTAAYELMRTDAWPTPVFRLGRLIKIPTAPMLALLGLGRTDDHAAASTPGQASTVEPARVRHAG